MNRRPSSAKTVTDKVVDASAIAAVLFDEPRHADIEARLRGVDLQAPAFVAAELASACLKKIRLGLCPVDVLLTLYGAFERLAVARLAIDFPETIQLALATKLSVYDASYLWLSRQMGAELVTLDERRSRAAAS